MPPDSTDLSAVRRSRRTDASPGTPGERIAANLTLKLPWNRVSSPRVYIETSRVWHSCRAVETLDATTDLRRPFPSELESRRRNACGSSLSSWWRSACSSPAHRPFWSSLAPRVTRRPQRRRPPLRSWVAGQSHVPARHWQCPEPISALVHRWHPTPSHPMSPYPRRAEP